jgi:hypothetical protein
MSVTPIVCVAVAFGLGLGNRSWADAMEAKQRMKAIEKRIVLLVVNIATLLTLRFCVFA